MEFSVWTYGVSANKVEGKLCQSCNKNFTLTVLRHNVLETWERAQCCYLVCKKGSAWRQLEVKPVLMWRNFFVSEKPHSKAGFKRPHPEEAPDSTTDDKDKETAETPAKKPTPLPAPFLRY